MSESSANLGSTKVTNELKKVQQPNNQSTESTQPTEVKSKTKPTLSLFMTRKDAEVEGKDVLALFDKYNVNSKTSDFIDLIELKASVSGKPFHIHAENDGCSEEEIKELHKLPTQKQFKSIINKTFKTFGISENVKTIIADLKDNSDKKDAQTLAREQLGIDLSEYSTEDEKANALAAAINSKYAINPENEDSVYGRHVERLKNGEFTDAEKELLGNRTEIKNEEQLKRFAQIATHTDQIIELAKFFAAGDASAQEMVVRTIGKYDGLVQTGIIGAAVLSADDKKTRENYAKLIANQDLNLTDASKKVFDLAMTTLQSHMDAKDSIKITEKASNFATASAQTRSFKLFDITERAKVERGELSQEEYDENYVKVYAESAYKMQEASKAYEYVIDRSNDNNREGAMGVLAANAYQIADESERGKAVQTVKNSEYYTDNAAERLNQSYARRISSQAGVSNPIQPKYTQEQDNFTPLVSQVFNATNEDAKGNIIDTVFADMSTTKGVSSKQYNMNMQRGFQLLNYLIKEDRFQGSVHEAKVLNKLKSLPTQTLTGLFVGSSSKTQNYFLSKGVVTLKDLELLNPSDERRLSQSVKDKLEEKEKAESQRS